MRKIFKLNLLSFLKSLKKKQCNTNLTQIDILKFHFTVAFNTGKLLNDYAQLSMFLARNLTTLFAACKSNADNFPERFTHSTHDRSNGDRGGNLDTPSLVTTALIEYNCSVGATNYNNFMALSLSVLSRGQ